MRLHHNGIIVSDMEKALNMFCDILGMKLILRRKSQGENLEIAFVEELNTGHRLELLLRKEGNGKMDHIAYEVEDVDKKFNELKEKKEFKVEKEPFMISSDTRSAFLIDDNGFKIQLVKYL